MEITEREIERAVDNANQVRLSELTEEEITIGTEVEGIEWDHWSNYNLIQGNRQIKANLIEKAKTTLLNSNSSISEIAFNLGFDYPQHFSQLFKKKVGMNPTKYRKSN